MERGAAEKSKKMSAAQMKEKLRESYPNRYEIKHVLSIDQYIKVVLKD